MNNHPLVVLFNLTITKRITDVTDFNVKGQKVYLSPIIDLFNREVVSYEIQKSAHLPLVTSMFDKAVERLTKGEQPIIHSDLRWQYQHSTIKNGYAKWG